MFLNETKLKSAQRVGRRALCLFLAAEMLFLNVPLACLPSELRSGHPQPGPSSGPAAWLAQAKSWLLSQFQLVSSTQSQQERNASVSSIEISPGDVMLAPGQAVFFAAIARDANNVPVPGVLPDWEGADMSNSQSVPVLQG